VRRRQQELVREAQVTLQAIGSLAGPGVVDPLSDPQTLSRAVTSGILDAPQLRNNPYGLGQVRTRIVKGQCLAVDERGRQLREQKRLRLTKS
jgi:hypothetical protein